MSKIYNNTIVTTGGFQFNSNNPLDDRLAVETQEDLSIITKYEGMIVYVRNEKCHYTYIDSNWKILQNDSLGNLMEDDDLLIIFDGGSADSILGTLDRSELG